jgi:hypothetical protein
LRADIGESAADHPFLQILHCEVMPPEWVARL